ncbi:MAG: hypothetical protein MK010_03405 [Erythrobacter sp.]|nr:hypothetical protein [Erythrobacter sp.]
MKKTILAGVSATALLIGLPATAQTYNGQTSDIDQMGDDNIADIEQSGNENVSDLDQKGDANRADVDQDDTQPGSQSFNVPANQSTILQNGDGALASVTQSNGVGGGSGNEASITQYSSDADGEVAASVDNRDYSNAASIDQTGGVPGDGNVATILQGADGTAVQGNMANISQSGNGNDAVSNQQSRNGLSMTSQDGDNNSSMINQTDDSADALNRDFDPVANVMQMATATIRQSTRPRTATLAT